MAPSPCTELDGHARGRLLALARSVIASGCDQPAQATAAASPPAALQAEQAVFVTLSRGGRLRGCIGSLEPQGPLAQAVAEAAHGAAFRDPRFPPLEAAELADLHIEISVLSPLSPLPVSSREALAAALRPGLDGLLLEDGPHRATFLPRVWEQLPDPRSFIAQLLHKAGLPPDHWSPTLRARRYAAQSFGGQADRP